MSIVRSVDATMKSFWVDIDSKPVLLDHIKQLNLYLSVGEVGEKGDLTITYDMYKMMSEESQRWSPVGLDIEFEIEDDKCGKRNYEGVITSFRKIHNVKQDLVILSFDKPKIIKLRNIRWWKCFEKTTVLEIFRQFLEAHEVPLNEFPENHTKLRSTHWEAFCIPQNSPTLDFLMAELAKDNLIIFSNPETGGITVASFDDLNRLDILNQNNPDYVVDGILAKFDQSKEQWKEATFVNAKQIDTRAPWNIMEWENKVAPTIYDDTRHRCVHYSGLKKPLYFDFEEKSLKPNDIYLEEVEELSGQEVASAQIAPYPAHPTLRKNTDTPTIKTEGYVDYTSQAIYPRYMHFRMRESYSTNIKWIAASMLIAGSAKAVVPLSTMMVTYFENAMNRDKNELAKGDPWQSGLYIIMGTQLIISGNNIMVKYQLSKPYGDQPAPERLEAGKDDDKDYSKVEESAGTEGTEKTENGSEASEEKKDSEKDEKEDDLEGLEGNGTVVDEEGVGSVDTDDEDEKTEKKVDDKKKPSVGETKVEKDKVQP